MWSYGQFYFPRSSHRVCHISALMTVARLAAWTTLNCEGGDYPHDDDFNVAWFGKEFRLRLGSRVHSRMIHKLCGSLFLFSLSFFYLPLRRNRKLLCLLSDNDQTHFSISIEGGKKNFLRSTNYNLEWF